MYCLKCGSITTDKNAKSCPRPGCDGKMKPNTGGFGKLTISRRR